MKISELEPNQKNVDVEAEIVDIGEIREFEKFGRAGRVATATLKDDSDQIQLTLWNEQIDMFTVGDKAKITGGYVKEWQGEKQLMSGKFGKIEKV